MVGIKKTGGDMLFNPPPETPFAAGDSLITLGEPSAIQNLERMAGKKEGK